MSAPEPVVPAPFVINCVAVDDEPLALGLVCSFIEQTPFLRLVGRHESAVAALRSLHERPDAQLLFLDIKMPDLSGLELAKVLQYGPRVIFTTAFNQYALGATDHRVRYGVHLRIQYFLHAVQTLQFRLIWCVIDQAGGRRTWTARIDKRKAAIELHVFDELEGALKVIVGFTGETNDEVA